MILSAVGEVFERSPVHVT